MVEKPVWVSKRRGNAKIHTCHVTDRAIVENHYGIFWNGIQFKTVGDAKRAAEQAGRHSHDHALTSAR